MKFMIIVKATRESEAGVMPSSELIKEMVGFHEEMQKAGILRDGSGLHPSSKGWRVKYAKGGKRAVVDGPFTETKELIAGYTIIEVKSREEAKQWVDRFPNPGMDGGDAEIEVRQFFEPEDFEPSEGVEKFKQMTEQMNKKT